MTEVALGLPHVACPPVHADCVNHWDFAFTYSYSWPDTPLPCAEPKLAAVMGELAHNLESFNPAFTAVLLKVQSTIGASGYVARDAALKNLIQPLAGEYGMHNGQAQGAPHAPVMTQPSQTVLGELSWEGMAG